jgi:hypothetical protein
MVAIEDQPGFVSSHLHGYSLWDSCVYHVPDCRSPEIVDKLTWNPCPFASLPPALAIVDNTLPVIMENQGDNLLSVALQGKSLLPLFLEYGSQLGSHKR